MCKTSTYKTLLKEIWKALSKLKNVYWSKGSTLGSWRHGLAIKTRVENWSSVPSTYIRWLITAYKCSIRRLHALSWPLWAPALTYGHRLIDRPTDTNINTIKNNMSLFLKVSTQSRQVFSKVADHSEPPPKYQQCAQHIYNSLILKFVWNC